MATQNNYDQIKYTAAGFGNIGMSQRVSDPRKDGYRLWKEPTSNNSGRAYLRKKDDNEGVDYLYDRVVTRTPVMEAAPFGGQRQKTTPSIFGMGGKPVFRTEVRYNKVKIAPGQNPRGYKPGEQPKRYNSTDSQGGGGNSYATKRSKAGQRGTVLTGSQGLGSAGDRKTVLGG